MQRAGLICLLLAAGCFAQPSDISDIPKQNPYQGEADVARGKQLFMGHCAPCHGPAGSGGKGANLARPDLPRASDDESLFRVLRQGIPGTEMPGAWEMIDHEIWQVAAFVRTLGRAAAVEHVPGDRAHGEQLVRSKGNCRQCHIIEDEGGIMGPPLNEVGLRRDAGFLRKTLLDPQSTVPEHYMFVDVVTRDKKKISGIRLSEDTYTIQIRDLSGRPHSFWKTELTDIHRDPAHTPMPSYRAVFAGTDLDDVVAYLASLRRIQ